MQRTAQHIAPATIENGNKYAVMAVLALFAGKPASGTKPPLG